MAKEVVPKDRPSEKWKRKKERAEKKMRKMKAKNKKLKEKIKKEKARRKRDQEVFEESFEVQERNFVARQEEQEMIYRGMVTEAAVEWGRAKDELIEKFDEQLGEELISLKNKTEVLEKTVMEHAGLMKDVIESVEKGVVAIEDNKDIISAKVGDLVEKLRENGSLQKEDIDQLVNALDDSSKHLDIFIKAIKRTERDVKPDVLYDGELTNSEGIVCDVCYAEFRDSPGQVARNLNCGHSYCESCINRLQNDTVIECPYCRERMLWLKGKASLLPRNFKVMDLVDKKAKTVGK